MKVIVKTFISLINNYLNEQTKYNQRNGGKKNSLKEGGSESHQFYREKFTFKSVWRKTPLTHYMVINKTMQHPQLCWKGYISCRFNEFGLHKFSFIFMYLQLVI